MGRHRRTTEYRSNLDIRLWRKVTVGKIWRASCSKWTSVLNWKIRIDFKLKDYSTMTFAPINIDKISRRHWWRTSRLWKNFCQAQWTILLAAHEWRSKTKLCELRPLRSSQNNYSCAKRNVNLNGCRFPLQTHRDGHFQTVTKNDAK